MKIEGSDSSNIQKIAVGTSVLFSNFYSTNIDVNSKLKSAMENPKCELYTTVLNIAELYHIIQKKSYEEYLSKNNLSSENFSIESFKKLENESKVFKTKFNTIYNKIKSFIHIEKFYLDENFEKEYAENYSNYNIFGFALEKFSNNNNIVNVL